MREHTDQYPQEEDNWGTAWSYDDVVDWCRVFQWYQSTTNSNVIQSSYSSDSRLHFSFFAIMAIIFDVGWETWKHLESRMFLPLLHNYFDAWLCSENQMDQFLEQCFPVKENSSSFYFDATFMSWKRETLYLKFFC